MLWKASIFVCVVGILTASAYAVALSLQARLVAQEQEAAVLKAVNLIVPLERERDAWMARATKAEVRLALSRARHEGRARCP